jgi:hypothetical protein
MTFRLFIYYCALGGGWAALLAWGVVEVLGILNIDNLVVRAGLIGGILGMLVAATIAFVDGLLNAVGGQRLNRALVGGAVGFPGGLLGAVVGELLREGGLPLFLGWMIAGVFIGASVGVFDVLRAQLARGDVRGPVKKVRNGVCGGFLGGFVGGAPFGMLLALQSLPLSKLAIGLVILGLCIGLLIGLAQVVLKEAWLVVESGRRAGRQMMLTRDETTIGRAEQCDLGLFGEHGIEKLHARILLKNNRYLLDDAQTPGGTFLNDARVERPTPLRHGDAIRVGSCVLRFGERQKHH